MIMFLLFLVSAMCEGDANSLAAFVYIALSR